MNTSNLKVECADFDAELNCSNSTSFLYRLPTAVKESCCEEYSSITPASGAKASLRAWYKCCEALADNDYSPGHTNDWENSSYQAYVMGVAVFAILMCLFVSGARSVRRRRALARMPGGDMAGMGSNRGPEFCTRVSLGPPTYGELEAGGLTKDFKSGALNPPPYPGIREEDEDYLAMVRVSSEDTIGPPPPLDESDDDREKTPLPPSTEEAPQAISAAEVDDRTDEEPGLPSQRPDAGQ